SYHRNANAPRPRVVIEVIHAGNDANLSGLATTETLTQHVNLLPSQRRGLSQGGAVQLRALQILQCHNPDRPQLGEYPHDGLPVSPNCVFVASLVVYRAFVSSLNDCLPCLSFLPLAGRPN